MANKRYHLKNKASLHKRVLPVVLVLLIIISLLSACAGTAIPKEELALLHSDSTPKASLSAIRVMSANVLVHIASWGGEPVAPRAERFAYAIQQYNPDVIAAQEFCSPWKSRLMPKISKSGYKLIKERYSLFVENRSPIIYNADKLEVADHGIHLFSKGDNNGCRVVSWAVFRTKTDGKVFAVTSTHLDLIREGKEDEQLAVMLLQADELTSVVDKIVKDYDCPVFMCGDYNCMEERQEYLPEEYYGAVSTASAAYTVYNKIADKYSDAKYQTDILPYDIGGGLLPHGGWSSPTWDHIFFCGEARVEAFAVLSSQFFQRRDDYTSRISDHLPIFADFVI